MEQITDLVGLTSEKRQKKFPNFPKVKQAESWLGTAILHQPDLLILDEPTNGLDPNQIIEIRNLIKDISKEKSLSSPHILCKR